MASSRLSRLALVLAALALSAAAQSPTRVRGAIAAFDGSTLSVNDLQLRVDEKTEIVFAQPITLADLKPGDFLAVTSTRRADGTLTAYEVRRFPKPVNPGHRPFDGRDGETMTNATVGAMVESTSGRELTLTYEGGAQKILVPANASISTLVPGQRSQLTPGAVVNLTAAAGPDGKPVARRIQVSPKAS